MYFVVEGCLALGTLFVSPSGTALNVTGGGCVCWFSLSHVEGQLPGALGYVLLQGKGGLDRCPSMGSAG